MKKQRLKEYYELNIVPSKNSYVETLTPSTQNVTIFENRSFEEVVKLKWGHLGGP